MVPLPKSETLFHSPVEIADQNYHSQFQQVEEGKWILRATRHMASYRSPFVYIYNLIYFGLRTPHRTEFTKRSPKSQHNILIISNCDIITKYIHCQSYINYFEAHISPLRLQHSHPEEYRIE